MIMWDGFVQFLLFLPDLHIFHCDHMQYRWNNVLYLCL